MPTYDNPRTGVVHWVHGAGVWHKTACHFLRSDQGWNPKNFDPIGAPADVTCCHCRETAAFLDAQTAAKAAEGDS